MHITSPFAEITDVVVNVPGLDRSVCESGAFGNSAQRQTALRRASRVGTQVNRQCRWYIGWCWAGILEEITSTTQFGGVSRGVSFVHPPE